jgi:hypothetical protein
MVTMRLPTGDKDNLRGLGVTRTTASFIASGGRGRFRPHGNVGYGYWSKGVSVFSDYAVNGSVEARHQFEYAAGLELEAAPKLTLLVDLLGGSILGGGKVDMATVPNTIAGASSTQALVALPEGIRRMSVAPGLKVNLKGKMLLSLNALIAVNDGGMWTRVIPVANIDLTEEPLSTRMSLRNRCRSRCCSRRCRSAAPELRPTCAGRPGPVTVTTTTTSSIPIAAVSRTIQIIRWDCAGVGDARLVPEFGPASGGVPRTPSPGRSAMATAEPDPRPVTSTRRPAISWCGCWSPIRRATRVWRRRRSRFVP